MLYFNYQETIMSSINMCIRIDSDLKKQAEDVLSQLGMTMNGTITMFLNQIVRERAVPLNLSLSAQDRTALNDIIHAREERKKGFRGYDADYVLEEMEEMLSVAESKSEYGKTPGNLGDKS